MVKIKSRNKRCHFCSEKFVYEYHHKIPKRILKRIPKFIKDEVRHEVFGMRSEQLIRLCSNCHEKLHKILIPFEKSILILSDLETPEKAIIRQKMKEKVLNIFKVGQRGDVNKNHILTKLEDMGLNRENSINLF